MGAGAGAARWLSMGSVEGLGESSEKVVRMRLTYAGIPARRLVRLGRLALIRMRITRSVCEGEEREVLIKVCK